MRGVNLEEKIKEDFHSIDAINDYFDNELTLEKNCTNQNVCGQRRETVMEDRYSAVSQSPSFVNQI